MARRLFTSESVTEGHPDKICDQISDAVLDAILEQDPNGRVACETCASTGLIHIMGEITTHCYVDIPKLARQVVLDIGYDRAKYGFDGHTCAVITNIDEQSGDIAMGVDKSLEAKETANEQLDNGAGDQGMMFGYASNETPALMPAPIYYAHKIVEELARLRHTEPEKYRYLRPDSKSQVSIRYSQGKPVAVTAVVVSHQHTPDMEHSWLEALVKEVVRKVVPAELLNDDIVYYVNPTGRFEIGGPHGDTGLTGRKIIVDTYGGVGSHGGGAFSGKDPSKVDRSAAYMCRYIAKNIVAAGLADKCEVQVAYAIGVAEPLSINVDTYGTGKLKSDQDLEKVIRKVFSLKPAAIVKALGLKNPGKGWSYADTAAYGHFGRPQFPWEKTDKVEEIKAAAAEYLK